MHLHTAPASVQKQISGFLFLLTVLTASPARAGEDWQALLDGNGGRRVHFGVAMEGREAYRRNADERLVPASTAKLFTAGAALELLGPDFRYPTFLRWVENRPGEASSLTIIGTGDPSWGMSELGEEPRSRLDRLAAMLKTAGISKILGEPVVAASDPRWNEIGIPEGWKQSDTSTCSGALALAFNFDTNCGSLKISSPTKASWQNPGLSFPVSLRIQSGSETSLTARLMNGSQGLFFLVEGSWKNGTPPQTLALPIYDTRGWTLNLFKTALAGQGIRLSPGAVAPKQTGLQKELVSYSEPLSILLKPFLKNSVNFMGDAFLKTIASQASWENSSLLNLGLNILRNFLLRNGANRDFALNDGSGLSRTSLTSPEMMLAFLERMKQSPAFPAFWGALPIAGVDGTLRNRMKGTAAEGVLRAKTGTLDGVYNLAGYVPNGNDFIPFVILTRTTAAEIATARSAEDRVGARLAALHNNGRHGPYSTEQVDAFPYVPEHAGADDQ